KPAAGDARFDGFENVHGHDHPAGKMPRRSYTIGPKRRMPRADATYVASAERRHRLDRPKGAVEDVCGPGTGEARRENNKKHGNNKKQDTDIRENQECHNSTRRYAVAHCSRPALRSAPARSSPHRSSSPRWAKSRSRSAWSIR